jgi:hypothetical protein
MITPSRNSSPTLIGEGAYRLVSCDTDQNICIKTLKPARKKRYRFFEVSYPTSLYCLLRFGISNFNRYEEEQYRRLMKKVPEHLECHFAKVLSCQGDTLFQELIRDNSGSVSETLEQAINIPANYWMRLHELMDFLISNDIFLFDIRAYNILVYRQSNEMAIPVLFDYKRIGARTYPLQPWLRFKWWARKKMRRRIKTLLNKQPLIQ